MLCLINLKNGFTYLCLFKSEIMRYMLFFILFTIALCSADEITQNGDQGSFGPDLEEFVRKMTQQQLQSTQRMAQQQLETTQNLQSAFLPQFRMPQARQRWNSQQADDSMRSLFNFPPFQSTGARLGGSHSQASASASVKRPYEGNGDTQASAFASVRDVDGEERLGEDINKLLGLTNEVASNLKLSSPPAKQELMMPSTTDERNEGKGEPNALHHKMEAVQISEDSFSDIYFVAIVAGCCAVGIFGVISAGICFYKLQKSRKAAADVDYPAYGVTGPNKDISSPNGDRKLAQSAQMYHYQHQKQQMIAVEKAGSTKNTSASDVDSEEENEEGDYTVYECPGLATTGEMEVKNPLFHDDSTPVSPPVLTSKDDTNQKN